MIYRLRTFLTGLLALLTAALLALAPASANPASGGYQLFEPVVSEHQADIQLASLGNFDYFAKIASECCNATNRTLSQIDNPVDLVGFRRDHIINRHGPGSGRPGKTEFPSNWDEQRILHNISDVATDPNSRRVVSSHGTQVYGVRDGVEIRVDLYPDSHPRFGGQISTGFPVAGPNVPVNP